MAESFLGLAGWILEAVICSGLARLGSCVVRVLSAGRIRMDLETGGEWVLAIAVGILAVLGVVLAMYYLW